MGRAVGTPWQPWCPDDALARQATFGEEWMHSLFKTFVVYVFSVMYKKGRDQIQSLYHKILRPFAEDADYSVQLLLSGPGNLVQLLQSVVSVATCHLTLSPGFLSQG